MWATLALATALNLAPSQSSTLQLTNARPTYGVLGQERKDSKVLPGDIFFVSFDIDGLKVGDDGQVNYSMGMELTNREGKSQYKQEPQEMRAFNALGGNRVPAFAHVIIGTDTPAGEYNLKVTVKDSATGKSDSLARKFEVVTGKFGFVDVGLTYFLGNANLPPPPAPPLAVPGQTLILNFAVTGFDLDKARKDQPNIETSLRIVDEAGKPTLAKPYSGEAKEVGPDSKKVIPLQFLLQVNRPGKFKLELKATDRIGGKSAEQVLDLTVIEPR